MLYFSLSTLSISESALCGQIDRRLSRFKDFIFGSSLYCLSGLISLRVVFGVDSHGRKCFAANKYCFR